MGITHPALTNAPPPPGVPLPPPHLVKQLAADYGQAAVLGMPFVDPAGDDNMKTKATPGATLFPFSAQASSSPSYWHDSGQWTILASSVQTGSSYSLLEQLLPRGPQAPLHVHEFMDEVFYMLDGQCTFLLGSNINTAGKGAADNRTTRYGARLQGGLGHGAPTQPVHAGRLRAHTAAAGPIDHLAHLATQRLRCSRIGRGSKNRLWREIGMSVVAVPDLFRT